MDTLVSNITTKIAKALKPTKIFLFGSRAKELSAGDSDVDLLIVYDGPLSKRDAKLCIRDLFPHPDFSMDLMILTSEEFARQRNIPTTIARTAIKEGIVCYG